MFLNTNKFKQLLKRAYKGTGFTLGSIDGAGIFVHSGYWMIWFERSVMPNRTKAAIIEFSGTLPEDGEIFKVREGEPNQYEIDQRKAFDVRRQWKDAKNPLKRLPVILSHYQTDICLYQDKYGRISAADALAEKIQSTRELDKQEGSIMGPCTCDRPMGTIFWATDRCVLGIYPVALTQGRLHEAIKALETYDFFAEEV